MFWRIVLSVAPLIVAGLAILAVSLGGCAPARLVTYCVAHPQNCN